jgi:hypothetical protein
LSIYTSAFSFYSDRKLWAWQYSLSIYELKYTSKQRNGAVICFSVRIDRLESYFPSAISSYYQDQLTTSLVHVDILNIVDIGMRFTILSCPNLWAFFVRISLFSFAASSWNYSCTPINDKDKIWSRIMWCTFHQLFGTDENENRSKIKSCPVRQLFGNSYNKVHQETLSCVVGVLIT